MTHHVILLGSHPDYSSRDLVGTICLGLGLSFKYITTILKGSEREPNSVESPFYHCIGRHLYLFPNLSSNNDGGNVPSGQLTPY